MDETKYYIWSWQHKMWWKPEGVGYTEKLNEAGTYTKEEAGDYTIGHHPPGEEVPVHEDWAKNFGKPPIQKGE